MSDIQTTFCDEIATAAEMLREGKLVAFPTETVYGLGADATNSSSVARIFESKGRPSFDPLIVHIEQLGDVHGFVSDFGPLAQQLAEAFWPGPLTLVLPKTDRIPDLVTAGLPGVGIRMPQHPVARELLRATKRPLAAPSANPFGGISPTTAQHVYDGLAGKIDGILDGGPCSVGVESTVLSLMLEQPTILRPGGLPIEEFEKVVGPVARVAADPSREDAAQPSPGMLSRHYSPRTCLFLCEEHESVAPLDGKRTGLLTYGDLPTGAGFAEIRQLSAESDLRTCAVNFFAALRSLDSHDLDVIIARKFPDKDLGVALNDRLRRASNGAGR